MIGTSKIDFKLELRDRFETLETIDDVIGSVNRDDKNSARTAIKKSDMKDIRRRSADKS